MSKQSQAMRVLGVIILTTLMLFNGGPVHAQTQLGSDIDGEAAGDNSGVAVSLSDDGLIVAIGAIYNDGNGADAGHVRVFGGIATAVTLASFGAMGNGGAAPGMALAVGLGAVALLGLVAGAARTRRRRGDAHRPGRGPGFRTSP